MAGMSAVREALQEGQAALERALTAETTADRRKALAQVAGWIYRAGIRLRDVREQEEVEDEWRRSLGID